MRVFEGRKGLNVENAWHHPANLADVTLDLGTMATLKLKAHKESETPSHHSNQVVRNMSKHSWFVRNPPWVTFCLGQPSGLSVCQHLHEFLAERKQAKKDQKGWPGWPLAVLAAFCSCSLIVIWSCFRSDFAMEIFLSILEKWWFKGFTRIVFQK